MSDHGRHEMLTPDFPQIEYRIHGHAGCHWLLTRPGWDGREERTWCRSKPEALALLRWPSGRPALRVLQGGRS